MTQPASRGDPPPPSRACRLAWYRGPVLAVLIALLTLHPCGAEPAPPGPAQADKGGKTGKADKEKERREAYDGILEEGTSHEGLLELVESEGTWYLNLRPEDLERPLLLLPTLARGIAEARLVGGIQLDRDDWVLEFRRARDRVELIRRNVRFHAPPGTPAATAVSNSYGDSLMASLEIAGENADGRVLVELGEVFLEDLVDLETQVGEALDADCGFDGERARIERVQVHAGNVELTASLSFDCEQATITPSVPDGRHLGLWVHYSLLALPEPDGFEPRPADDRVGHFLTAWRDPSRYDEDGGTVRWVNRWHLAKADPEAEASPVEQPIVFYLDPSIPHEFRTWVREGILAWNRAFEAIGLLDAIEVRGVPKDEEVWAEDSTRSTLRWIAEGPFTATGPSRADPRSGRILDSDILFNGSALMVFRERARMFGIEGGLPEEHSGHRRERPRRRDRHPPCEEARGLAEDLELAGLFRFVGPGSSKAGAGEDAGEPGKAADADTAEPEDHKAEYRALVAELLGPAVRKTVMHEVGHALGLRHNFAASTAVPFERLHDVAFTSEHGLTASIMDYVPINVAAPGETQGEYFSSTLGPYDYWAIEYAYREFPDDGDGSEGDDGEDGDEAEADGEEGDDGDEDPGPDGAEAGAEEDSDDEGEEEEAAGADGPGDAGETPSPGGEDQGSEAGGDATPEAAEATASTTAPSHAPWTLPPERAALLSAKLSEIASRAAEPELVYGSDEDRSEVHERNLDPRTQAYDLGDDPLRFAESRARLLDMLWSRIGERGIRSGESRYRIRRAIRVMLAQLARCADIALPYIGGMTHSRDHKGDPGERPAFVPLPADRQRQALAFLVRRFLGDPAHGLVAPGTLARAAPDPWSHPGSEGYGERIDFPLHRSLAAVHQRILARLLSPRVFSRLQDAPLHLPPGEAALEPAELLATVTEAIWGRLRPYLGPLLPGTTPAPSGPTSSLGRIVQRLHFEALSALLAQTPDESEEEDASEPGYSDASGLARAELRRLASACRGFLERPPGDAADLERAHFADLARRIGQTLDAEVHTTLEPPEEPDTSE